MSARVKYPKIWHLPWSDGVDQKSDHVFTPEEVDSSFAGAEVVVTEKCDGECTTMYRDGVHARSLDSRHHPSRDWVKRLHATIAHEIPEGWRICGENMYATHSIHYQGLPGYFLVFGIYNEANECFSWAETVDQARAWKLPVVPLLWKGKYTESAVRACFTGQSVFMGSMQEGYVLRVAGRFPWARHRISMGKYVRAGHVQTDAGWMHRAVYPNELI